MTGKESLLEFLKSAKERVPPGQAQRGRKWNREVKKLNEQLERYLAGPVHDRLLEVEKGRGKGRSRIGDPEWSLRITDPRGREIWVIPRGLMSPDSSVDGLSGRVDLVSGPKRARLELVGSQWSIAGVDISGMKPTPLTDDTFSKAIQELLS